ncbi:LamG domain-containing protein [Sunxiuqinia indica]|uniref:LamG domain-containing protein n=1 Tax=Sunxiuqinia indica TaxID=2692584 RepID=UPI001356D6DF|nr:LamG domain-containing protein [Sunxiuqinia indica]
MHYYYYLLIFSMISYSQITDLCPATILESKSFSEIIGTPKLVDSPYGQAVYFDGIDDALFVDSMPLTGLSQFTIEAIFRPDHGGSFEQRFLHFGEPNQARLLFEIRTTETDWYFDAYLNSGKDNIALIDPNILHPLDQWYHVALVVNKGQLTTYVNHEKELEGEIELVPIISGQTSIGVRQNKVSWFKGAIYNVKITPRQLTPKDFLSIEM